MKTTQWLGWTAVLLSVVWVSAVVAQDPPQAAERAEKVFDALDADGDGGINKDEFVNRIPKVIQRLRQRDQGMQLGCSPQGPWGGQMDRGTCDPGARYGQREIGRFGRGLGPFFSGSHMKGHGFRKQGMGRGAWVPGSRQRGRQFDRSDRRRVGPAERSYMKGYGFGKPGTDRDAWGPGYRQRGRQFDQPGRMGSGYAERPYMRGYGFRGRGGPQDAPWADRPSRRGLGKEGSRLERGKRGIGAPQHFGMMDVDGDGKIQKTELQRVRDMLNNLIDEVGDREVSQEQLRKIFRKLHGADSPKQKSHKPKAKNPQQ